MIILIAAIGENNELGKDNQLLWHLPKDLQHFKQLTIHHPIIMGRKTYESLPGLLPKRPHIVISQNPNYIPKNKEVILSHSIEDALEKAKKHDDTLYIIGGGNIYSQTLEMADMLKITKVESQTEADTFFPEIRPEEFQLTHRVFHPKDAAHPFAFEFQTYKRIKPKENHA